MAVREARASRFVSHLAGLTVSDKLPKLSKVQRLWLQEAQRLKVVAVLPVAVVPHPLTYSDQQDDRENLPQLD